MYGYLIFTFHVIGCGVVGGLSIWPRVAGPLPPPDWCQCQCSYNCEYLTTEIATIGQPQNGHMRFLNLCIPCGVHIFIFYTQDGFTPLHYASEGGHDGIVQLLCEAGSVVDKQTKVCIAAKLNLTFQFLYQECIHGTGYRPVHALFALHSSQCTCLGYWPQCKAILLPVS